MTTLELNLLGGFEARLDTGQRIALTTRKGEALLTYLALAQGKARSRDQLVGLLWSDRSEAQAKSSLRQALTSLRQGLQINGTAIVATEGEDVSLKADTVSVDVLEFERLAANGSNGNLARAEKLYQGPFLDGFTVRDPAFNDWLARERARLHELAVSAVDRLLAGLLRDSADEAAIAAAQRLLVLDPLRESTYRTLMRLYAKQGQRGLAARQYEVCREMLSRELGVAPAPATRRLYEEIVGAAEAGESQPRIGLQATGPLPLPAKPSVAVLPFANLSGDPEQSYLSDGITEDVITDLSRFPALFVIGAESSLALRDRTANLAQVAKDLGVEYVVEGSVRKAGETLRVTVQLIDPATGHRLWAERYDRPFAEVFSVQDEIVGNIAGTLSVNIEQARAERTRGRPTETLDAYDCCLRAKQGLLRFTAEGYAEAKQLFHKAVEIDPGYAAAWAGLATAYNKDACFMPGADPTEPVNKIRTFAEKALSLDHTLPRAHLALAWAHLRSNEPESARRHFDRASDLNQNDSEVLALRGAGLAYLGELDSAMETAQQGLRVNPYSPDMYLDTIGTASFLMGRYRDGLRYHAQMVDSHPEDAAWQAARHAYLGQEDAARRKVEEFLRGYSAMWCGDPEAGPEDYVRWILDVSNPFQRDQDRERLAGGLRRAGLPA